MAPIVERGCGRLSAGPRDVTAGDVRLALADLPDDAAVSVAVYDEAGEEARAGWVVVEAVEPPTRPWEGYAFLGVTVDRPLEPLGGDRFGWAWAHAEASGKCPIGSLASFARRLACPPSGACRLWETGSCPAREGV